MDPLSFTPTDRWRRAHEVARVIEDARQLAVPKLPQREAAERAGLSPTYWPVIIRGWRLSGGVQAPVTPPDDTLRRMARAVGAEDEVLAILQANEVNEPGEGVPSETDFKHMPADDLIALIRELASRVPKDDEVLHRTAQLMLAIVEERSDAAERERDAG